MNYGFVINNETCIGCHACSTACKSENDVPLGVNRTWVKSVETGLFPDVTRHFQVTRCNHCENPPCVRICPVEAMYRREDGIVEFDGDICIGCKACLQACPYDAIYIDPNSGTAAKCHYCAHRIDVGLEPACVVVCPEHAIIAGDMHNPDAEISRTLARRKVTVRKPEQATVPNVFYVGGEDAAMQPTNTDRAPASFAWADVLPIGDGERSSAQDDPLGVSHARLAEQMVQVVYNAQHKIPWHWQVPAYLVTKAIAAGLFLILAFGSLVNWFVPDSSSLIASSLTSLVFLGLTTLLLVFDLERPERFLRILTRPQWKSWLARGAFILVLFSLICTVWAATELGLLPIADDTTLDVVRSALFWIGIPFAIATAIYTAYLFGQAEGRDLWQSTLLPIHLLTQALMAGGASLVILGTVVPSNPELFNTSSTVFFWMVLLDLGMLLTAEFGMPHASEVALKAAHEIKTGRYRKHFWLGGIVVGHVLPFVLLAFGGLWSVAAAVLAVAGLYYYEYAFVLAPQELPNS